MGRRSLIAFIILLTGFDLLSKYLVDAYVQYNEELYPFTFLGIKFSITHTINKGAAFGIFSNWQLPLLIFRIGLVCCLAIYSVFFNTNRLLHIPLTLIVTGATCNLFDYFIYGHVVDMIHTVLWGFNYPVFNLADCYIFIGVCCLLFLSVFKSERV